MAKEDAVNNFELENWLPMGPAMGPPLPRFLNVFWPPWIPWYKPPLPEPPEMGVVVGLLNPPSGANKWQMIIIDDVMLKTSIWEGDIKDAATFELSPEWLFPLMVSISIHEEWQENGEWHARQLYYVQSYQPIKPFTADEEDPTYKEVFIPEYGSYYYNVAQERFEKV